ncbi:MAG: hypothetical protein GX163_07635 [Bacteroidetes bacterium]|jgi:hypothetical protein|nr:hypothetical protein [Bacteroidota bacterium]
MNKKSFLIFIIAAVLFSLPAEAQCAMCRAVLESEESGGAAKGINNGILYLMIFPYLLVGGVLYAVYRSRKKAKAQGKL